MSKTYKAIISLSGGLDSTVLLSEILQTYCPAEILAVSFFYGSKHNKYENEACKQVANFYHVDLLEINVAAGFISFQSDLLLTGGEIPEGHYQAENMKATVVPARNMIFISYLAGLAISYKATTIFLGVHQGDHAIYPDCRPEFIEAIKKSVELVSDGSCFLSTPFLLCGKSEIVLLGHRQNAPLKLTRTCYKDQPLPCGKCGSCVERVEAFTNNELLDPVMYQPLDRGEKK